jgi:phage repressor protein C with HTH and peptisase S24 domain
VDEITTVGTLFTPDYQIVGIMSNGQGKKLKRFLRLNDISADELAEKVGKSRSTIYNWMELDVIPTDVSVLLKAAGVELEDYPVPNKVSEVKESYTSGKGNIIYVPLIAYGGFLQGYANKVYIDSLEHFSLPGVIGEHFAFEVDGMSMWPMAAPGDTAIARPEEKIEWMVKGKPYVLQTTDGLLIKTYEGIKGEKAIFTSINPDYDGVEIPLKSIKKVYFVTRILKKV